MGLKLIGEVALDGSGFERGLNTLGASAERFGHELKSMIGGMFAMAAFEELIRGAMETADKINRLSEVYGLSTKTLQQWSYAAYLNDTSLEALTKSYKKFATAKLEIERNPGGEMADNLKLLNIEAGRLRVEAPEKLMYEIAAGMASASENSGQFAAAIKILGKNADDVLPALKMLAGGGANESPLLSDNEIKLLANESDNLKRFWAKIKGGAGSFGAELSGMHNRLGNIVDDAISLKELLTPLWDKTTSFSERWDQIQQQSHGRWARSKQLEGWRGGAMVFDRNAAIQGETDKRGQSSMSVDEMVEAAQKLQQAEDIRERARISFLSREERITELLEQQASLMKESDQSRYGPGYAATELQLAKNWLELAQLEKAQNKPDKEKVKRWDRPATGDSLTRVGNFLGSSRDALNDIGLRQISLLQRIADNTAQGDGSGGYPAWDEDFPNT